MKTRNNFLDRLIERMDRLDPASIQSYLLRLSRDKGFLETIFNTIQEGVIVIDRTLAIQYINHAAQHLLGIPADARNEPIDRYLQDVDWSPLVDWDPEQWHRMSRQKVEVFYPAYRYLSFYLVPMWTESQVDDFALATLIVRDVTEAHRDTEKTIESQKVQAITTLAAGVAHELGNPLNSLNIHLQLLSRCLARTDDRELAEEARELLTVASNEVQRLDTIVSNFLRAVRPVPLDMRRLTIEKVLGESLAFMRVEIEDKKIMVEASWPDQITTIMGDADQLKQAFYNIIKNAVQAMPDGGILQIACSVGDDFLDIRFEDTGKGISQEDLSRITEPYFTTRPGGTGLGLLIVDRVVRSHGGELVFEGGNGKGAAVTVRLPLRERRVRLLTAAKSVDAADR